MSKRHLTLVKTLGTGALALVLSVAILPVKSIDSSQAIAQEGPTVEDVADDTDELIGQTVTIRGAVEELGSDSTFILKDEELFGLIDDAEVLIINRTGAPLPTRPSDSIELQVTGKVGQFVRADVERELNLDLSSDEYVDYEKKPVVYADSIALSPSSDEIFKDPQSYYGKTVAVKGEVADIVGANTFTLKDDDLRDDIEVLGGGKTMLAINVATEQLPEANEIVLVTGVVRPFVVADIEREYNFSFDEGFDSQLVTEYENQPVLIVEQVFVIEPTEEE